MNPFLASGAPFPLPTPFTTSIAAIITDGRAILGINPGRFGAGITGIPFTDPKRLAEFCDIHIEACPNAHEPSSLFVYEVIEAWGGLREFYDKMVHQFHLPAWLCKGRQNGRETNYNYYDSAELTRTALPLLWIAFAARLQWAWKGMYASAWARAKLRFYGQAERRTRLFGKESCPCRIPAGLCSTAGAAARNMPGYVEKLREYS